MGVSEYQDYQFQDYIRYGLELAEYHLLESYDGVKDKTDETDRVFLESVQVCFFCILALRCKDICYKKSNLRCFGHSSAGLHILYILYPHIMISNLHKADSLVQSVIDALRQINTDPARTPTALAVSFAFVFFNYIFISTYILL